MLLLPFPPPIDSCGGGIWAAVMQTFVFVIWSSVMCVLQQYTHLRGVGHCNTVLCFFAWPIFGTRWRERGGWLCSVIPAMLFVQAQVLFFCCRLSFGMRFAEPLSLQTDKSRPFSTSWFTQALFRPSCVSCLSPNSLPSCFLPLLFVFPPHSS